jgi:putative FmdB family regulatory protein
MMPVYNYVCMKCGAHFDQWHSFKDADMAVVCPNGHAQTRKVLTAPTVVFKGSGFYATDHRRNTSQKAG